MAELVLLVSVQITTITFTPERKMAAFNSQVHRPIFLYLQIDSRLY